MLTVVILILYASKSKKQVMKKQLLILTMHMIYLLKSLRLLVCQNEKYFMWVYFTELKVLQYAIINLDLPF